METSHFSNEKSTSGHRKRIRDKYLKSPERVFPDYEILEMLLYSAIPRSDTKVLAKHLLKAIRKPTCYYKCSN